MLFYLLLSFSVHFTIIFGYSFYNDVIPPLLDLQPCDAVFSVVLSDLKPPFFGVVIKPPFLGVVCSDLKPPFLGSGEKHWH